MTTQLNRRKLLRTGALGVAALGAGLIAAPAFANTILLEKPLDTQVPQDSVDETYCGRLISIRYGQGMPGVPASVTIDGQPLHIMPISDGVFVSMANHYEPYSSMRELAHAAVDNLYGFELRSSHGHHG